MAFNREMLEGILKQLDTESLIKALSVVGINVGEPAMDENGAIIEALTVPESEKIPSWNEVIPSVEATSRPPITDGKNYLQEPKKVVSPVLQALAASQADYTNRPQDQWRSQNEINLQQSGA